MYVTNRAGAESTVKKTIKSKKKVTHPAGLSSSNYLIHLECDEDMLHMKHLPQCLKDIGTLQCTSRNALMFICQCHSALYQVTIFLLTLTFVNNEIASFFITLSKFLMSQSICQNLTIHCVLSFKGSERSPVYCST